MILRCVSRESVMARKVDRRFVTQGLLSTEVIQSSVCCSVLRECLRSLHYWRRVANAPSSRKSSILIVNNHLSSKEKTPSHLISSARNWLSVAQWLFNVLLLDKRHLYIYFIRCSPIEQKNTSWTEKRWRQLIVDRTSIDLIIDKNGTYANSSTN